MTLRALLFAAMPRFALMALPTLVFHLALQVTEPAIEIYIFLAAAALHLGLAETHPKWRGLPVEVVSWAFAGIGGFVTFTLILVTPVTAYLLWFDLIKTGDMRGIVSYTFTSLIACFALLGAISIRDLRKDFPRAVALVGALALLTAFIVYRNVFLLVGAAFALSTRLRPKAMIHAAQVGLAAITLALVFSINPQPKGMAVVDAILSPALRNLVLTLVPEFPILYGVPGHGYGFAEDRLGSPPILSQRPILTVSGPLGATYYLRTVVYDLFSGNGWGQSAQPIGGDYSYLVSGVPANLSAATSEITVEVMCDYFPYVPHTLEARSVVLKRPTGLTHTGNLSAGFVLDRPLLHGETVRILLPSLYSDRANIDLSRLDRSRYTSIPAALSPDVRSIGRALRQLEPAVFLSRLKGVLSEGYEYTLNPKQAGGPQGTDFLHNFLFRTREGFCVHFATAATILARIAEVPARYVSGFLVSMPADEYGDFSGGYVAEVTGLSAHAWAEFWFPEIGWITFEATPPMQPENYGDAAFWEDLLSRNDATARQLAAIRGTRAAEQGPEGGVGLWPAALPVGALVLAGLAAKAHHFLRSSAPKDKTGDRRVRKLARAAVRQAGRLGVPHPRSIGWLAWERLTAESVARLDGESLDGQLRIFRDCIFGARTLTRNEIVSLGLLNRRLNRISLRGGSRRQARV